LKNIYWMLIIAVTFVIGVYLGQQKSNIAYLMTKAEDNTVTNQLVTQSNQTKELTSNRPVISQAHNQDGASSTAEIFEKIDQVLHSLEVEPEDRKLMIELYSLVNKLSLIELDSLILTLNDKSKIHRDMLARLITGQLIELDPRKALSFARQFNSMPDNDYYLALIKSAIAKKDPEYGFELFLEDINASNSETKLSVNSALINELAKHDLNRLMNSLLQYKNQGVDINNSLWGLSNDLKSSDEFSELFDQLRRLDDLTLLDSAIIKWVDISAADLFNKLNDIDDANERKVLIEKAQSYWLMKDPESAADSLLMQGKNKKEILADIVQRWPEDQAKKGLLWLSRQQGIDINSYKIELLDDLIYSKPDFVQAHLDEIELDKDKEAAFHLKLYLQLKARSSNKAEQFLDGLPSKSDVIALIEKESDVPKESTSKVNYRDAIDKAFNNYYNYKEAKAFAVAIDSESEFAWSFRVNKANQSMANKSALESCERYRLRANVTSACTIYAEGDVLLFDL